MYTFNREEYNKRMEWYLDARFGMFIHWGLYSIPARGEWVRSEEEITREDYMKYFEEFDPVDYDPKKWARAAKEAGMKYVVLTAKHHDGFCLFDSQYTDFKSTNTKCGRDLVREYVDAVRAEGLKVGIYFTIIDWYHEDYPHYGDRQHPMRNNPEYKNDGRNFDNYLTYMHNQIREICTNYGKIDILWFDFSYDDLRGEAWKATELMSMVRSLQPDVIVVVAFGQLIPASVLELPKYGCINVHASLLPAYRGAAPIQWAVINGEKESGVTIMQMDAGLDTGDMLAKTVVPLDPEETGGSLFDKLSHAGAELLTETLEKLVQGTLVPEKQPEESPTEYARMIKKEDGRIDWTRPAAEIERLIRGMNPWPSAYTKLQGKTLKIWKSEVREESFGTQPGQVVGIEEDALLIQTGKGSLAVKELQLEGRKRMDTSSFLRGFSVSEHEVLG